MESTRGMTATRGSRGRRRLKTRAQGGGQSMVELALTAPLLFLLLFGIIDFGYVFNSYHELRSASRDGARLAVVDNGCFPGGPDALDAAKCPPGGGAAQLLRLKTDTIGRATGLANPANMTAEVCFDNPPTVGTANVYVTLRYPASSLTGYLNFALNNIILESRAVMRLEQTPTFSEDLTCP